MQKKRHVLRNVTGTGTVNVIEGMAGSRRGVTAEVDKHPYLGFQLQKTKDAAVVSLR